MTTTRPASRPSQPARARIVVVGGHRAAVRVTAAIDAVNETSSKTGRVGLLAPSLSDFYSTMRKMPSVIGYLGVLDEAALMPVATAAQVATEVLVVTGIPTDRVRAIVADLPGGPGVEVVDFDDTDYARLDTDDEQFCPDCFAGMTSSEHHEKCEVEDSRQTLPSEDAA